MRSSIMTALTSVARHVLKSTPTPPDDSELPRVGRPTRHGRYPRRAAPETEPNIVVKIQLRQLLHAVRIVSPEVPTAALGSGGSTSRPPRFPTSPHQHSETRRERKEGVST